MGVKLQNDNELIVVDDDHMETMLLERYLRKSKLKNPLRAFNTGAEFLEYLDEIEQCPERYPALVLVDVRMPVMNGFELVAKVRERQAFNFMPVIAMFSNSDEQSDTQQAIAAGANQFTVKPQDGKSYLEFLNSLLDEPVAAGEGHGGEQAGA